MIEQKYKIGEVVWYLYFYDGEIEVRSFVVAKLEFANGNMYYFASNSVSPFLEEKLYSSKDEAINSGVAMLEACGWEESE